ncbi:unnamed protein product, partial [Polarella glacialis]
PGFSHGAAGCVDDDSSLPLDLEARLRRAATKASPPGVLDSDMLEAMSCQACEVLERFERGGEGALEALQEALEPFLCETSLERGQ